MALPTPPGISFPVPEAAIDWCQWECELTGTSMEAMQVYHLTIQENGHSRRFVYEDRDEALTRFADAIAAGLEAKLDEVVRGFGTPSRKEHTPMQALGIANYTVIKGTFPELVDEAKRGMLSTFKAQPGFIRYGLADTGEGTCLSISLWETHAQAEAAAPCGRHLGARARRGPGRASLERGRRPRLLRGRAHQHLTDRYLRPRRGCCPPGRSKTTSRFGALCRSRIYDTRFGNLREVGRCHRFCACSEFVPMCRERDWCVAAAQVPSAGIGPATPGLGNRCSIH